MKESKAINNSQKTSSDSIETAVKGKKSVKANCLFIALEYANMARRVSNDVTLYLEFGALEYYISKKEEIHNYKPFDKLIVIKTTNANVQAYGSGTLKFLINIDGIEQYRMLPNVY